VQLAAIRANQVIATLAMDAIFGKLQILDFAPERSPPAGQPDLNR
jgi:hypothetical protein